jgi:RNA-directed DNA polymerase
LSLGPHTYTGTQSVPELLTRGDAAKLLEVPLETLNWWIWVRRGVRYHHFEIGRKNGENRSIHAPIKPIKDLQRRLASVLSSAYMPPTHVHGFVPRRSPLSNARPHRRQRWVLRLDIADFFPSINFGRVRGMFMAFPFEYPADVATLLAQLCCHEDELPQGAPTSPIISNYICRRLDTQLAHLARSERCYYTRYADDLCFSTDRRSFPQSLGWKDGETSRAGSTISEIIESNGFVLNETKTRLMRKDQRQRVTGFVVNEKINLSSHYVRQLRGLLYIWKRYGEEAAVEALARTGAHVNWPDGKPAPNFALVVRGRVQYLGKIKGWDHPTYLKFADTLKELDPKFTRPARKTSSVITAQVFTEGESDGLHLRAAHRYFTARGEFTDISFEIHMNSGRYGHDALLRRCKALADVEHTKPCVCLFDRDTPKIIKEVGGVVGWRNWGKGVVSAVLVPPPWRAERVCIELLHDESVIKTVDENGRRLFVGDEFDVVTGHHTYEPYTTPHPRRDALVYEDVHTKDDGKSIGLSKTAFAEAIVNESGGFADVSFAGFHGTMEKIREALLEAMEDIRHGGIPRV